jgi:hypothetical protein
MLALSSLNHVQLERHRTAQAVASRVNAPLRHRFAGMPWFSNVLGTYFVQGGSQPAASQ